jgi:hypothetical protein
LETSYETGLLYEKSTIGLTIKSLTMVKGRRYRLVYSRRYPFDTREYGNPELIYTNNFDSLVRVICAQEIEQARKRVKCNKSGSFYSYTPSKEYLKALSKFHSH